MKKRDTRGIAYGVFFFFSLYTFCHRGGRFPLFRTGQPDHDRMAVMHSDN